MVEEDKTNNLPKDGIVNKEEQQETSMEAPKGETTITDKDFDSSLGGLFEPINIHEEIKLRLAFGGVKEWSSFIWMDDGDIHTLTKQSRAWFSSFYYSQTS